jgi:enoyl-CoA hydratase/carnithine racemase
MDITLPEDCGLAVSRAADVVTITLNDPQRRNPQTPATWLALTKIADSIPAEVVAVLITGAGSSFSAGLDRRMFTPAGISGQESLVHIARRPDDELDSAIAAFQDGFRVLRAIRPITIALVQGHAVGAGFQLALAADLMVVAHDVELSMREAQFGLVPDLTGTHTLVRAMGYSQALELCLTGRSVGAAEAVQRGLAVASVPADDLLATGQRLIDAIRLTNGAALDLKPLLLHAQTADPLSQHSAERLAQAKRLRALLSALDH